MLQFINPAGFLNKIHVRLDTQNANQIHKIYVLQGNAAEIQYQCKCVVKTQLRLAKHIENDGPGPTITTTTTITIVITSTPDYYSTTCNI